jgi:hypothetical protein
MEDLPELFHFLPFHEEMQGKHANGCFATPPPGHGFFSFASNEEPVKRSADSFDDRLFLIAQAVPVRIMGSSCT